MANPIGQRFSDLVRSRNAFVAVAWVLALVAAAILYLRTPEFAGVPGVVEVVDYNVAAPETLRVVSVPVQVGTPVHQGDILAVLDPVPLTL
jgi:multidrug efflux pump subunit AcrA (membrane-fusion protein)